MGLVGLANTVAIEGANYNIHCNVIVPTAASRLTEDILPPELYAELKPELIAPIVVSILIKCLSSYTTPHKLLLLHRKYCNGFIVN